ncbi:HI0933 family protein [Methanolacinia petrolearia DSM 11571]|uniref:HI0933 family protein n=1 Tax=Methanolacinia petrolearia (strain DSM 11571 / OCM 486 / SEBR 4847) TaxID=679926 RepID=E1RK54_METP4|nr:NAD(P)/FAD-dependent oxidoreductase [Methanolacinia petrolearia]ADN35777.1 HI0933 family protein [Methanolacinia petrolearia DSM 11571]
MDYFLISKELMKFDVIIVGGGPAGLFCAIHSAGEGKKVLILEKKTSCGRKLLITGSGQCNLTHEGEISEFLSHYNNTGRFLRPALMNFTNKDLVDFFVKRGVSFETDKNGKIFPSTKKASDILSVLLRECEVRGVSIRCGEPVLSVKNEETGFNIETTLAKYYSKNLVVSTGGASYPQTGSSGDGYKIAESLSQTVTEIAPALAPVYPSSYPFGSLSGISFNNARISLFRDNKKIADHTGDILLTHKGLSGPGILDFSRNILPVDVLKISFMTGMNPEEFRKDFTQKTDLGGTKLVRTILSEYSLPERFAREIIEISGISPDLTCAHLPKKERNVLIKSLTEYPFEVRELGKFDEAMVTRGGVALEGINPKTMESKIVPGLFFVGEILDIDGDTGGYNLQAAFSTGFLAAKTIISRL